MEPAQHNLPATHEEKKRPINLVCVQLVLAALLCALTFGLKRWYPQTAQTLRPWIIGQEDNRVMQAFSALTDTMQQGKSVGQAVQAFYMEMTGEAS